ncbi:hypothetical protein LXA55_18190, partial [Erwinia amylovora]|uniref:hypothetical protein n=1 Tax=Erwinia amylovora TaxID=552 RepID=UPI0020C1233E
AYRFRNYISGFCLYLVLLGCRSAGHSGRMVFRYNEATGIATLDPACAKNQSIMWAVHQLYNTLVQTDQQLNFAPSLARSWDVSPDRM